MRVIVLSTDEQDTTSASRLDAQIRVGGDAGASEVIVLRAYGDTATDQESLITGLLLPDAPVVAWWPGLAPERVSTSAIGRIATRRITDAADDPDPLETLRGLSHTYAPGDTDFAWTRLTLWRAQLAAVLDQPPYEPVTAIEVFGSAASPSTMLLAAWLQQQLKVAVDLTLLHEGNIGIKGVHLHRKSGVIKLDRSSPTVATLMQPGQPVHDITLPRRNLRDCLSEELRRLDPDDLYGEVIQKGLARVEAGPKSKAKR